VARRLRRWLVAVIIVTIAAGYAVVNFAEDEPARWNLDPAAVDRTGRPNDFLSAPMGFTRADPDRGTRVFPMPPAELLNRFADVARSAPRVEQLPASPGSEILTFIQRSAIVGFPDYISVKAVPVGDGSALIVYSRSRYGHGDFGVNRARVEAWLGALD